MLHTQTARMIVFVGVCVSGPKYALVNGSLFELNGPIYDFCTKINDSAVHAEFSSHANNACHDNHVLR